ncbi:MAG: 4Fe-4S dicluster domain-containing protein [Firmicutes bacterium]|jgi:Fe-S-cluster-containing hydrogenase component 2|nr:4Fe-4S dicluster domain-containing protein [Bacillota bacterium]
MGTSDTDIRLIDPALCTGCRNCELVCAIAHFRVFNPTRSRIRITRDGQNEKIGVCIHCVDTPCVAACPRGAILASDGDVLVDEARCDLCGRCAPACRYGGLHITRETVLICDMCHGDPQCAKYCVTGAITLKPPARRKATGG